MTVLRFGTFSCAALLAAGTAHAQDGERRINIGAATSVAYDDNVARSSPERAAARGISQDDIFFRPGLTVDVLVPLGRQSVTLVGDVGYTFYVENTRLNRERINLLGAAALRFAQCDGGLNASFSRQQSDLEDLVFGPGLDESIVNTQTTTTIGGSATCGSAVGLRPTGSVSYTRARNSGGRRGRTDFNSLTLSGGVSFSRPVLGTLTLSGSYTTTDYPERDQFIGIANNGYDVYAGTASLQRNIGARLSGTIQVGYSDVKPRDEGVPGYSGLTWNVNLSARVSERLQVNGALGQAVQASNLISSSFFINKTASLDASYFFGDRLIFSPGISWRERDIRGETGVLGPVLGGDKTSTIHADLSYRQSDRLSFGLILAHVRRDAEAEFYDYTSNRATISARLSF